MSYCPECGSEVANNDTFCAFCGISLEVVAEPSVSEDTQLENTPKMGEPEKIQTSATLDKDPLISSETLDSQPEESLPMTPPTPFILEENPTEDVVEKAVESEHLELSPETTKTAEQIFEKTADFDLKNEVDEPELTAETPEVVEHIEEPTLEIENPIVSIEAEKTELVSHDEPEEIEIVDQIKPIQEAEETPVDEDIDEFIQTIPYTPKDYAQIGTETPEPSVALPQTVEEDKLKSDLDKIDNNLQAENNLETPVLSESIEEKAEPLAEPNLAEEGAFTSATPIIEEFKLEEPQIVEEQPIEAITPNEIVDEETPISEAIPILEETSVVDETPAISETPVLIVAEDKNLEDIDNRSYTNPNIGVGDTDGRNKQKLKPLDEGTVLNSRYEVVRKIGGGGMGAVYLANDRNLGGVLRAVKEMVQSYIEDEAQEKAVNDFKRESLLLTSLEHPGIPTIYDYFFDEKEGRFYLVMKYISGGDLAARLRAAPEGRIDEVSITDWAIQIADVLDYLHNRQPPIVYRDLKPSNIMIDGNTGKVMIIDFGIARWVNKEEKGVTAVGTMGYAPPELFSGNVEPRSDIYSLGSTMFHLLTGADPQSNPLLIFDFNKNPRPRQINPSLSDQMEQILMRSVEYNSDQRFDSGAEMRDELIKHLENLKKGAITFGVVSATSGQQSSNLPVFCGFCGQKILLTDMFCPFCGAQQPLQGQSQNLQATPAFVPTNVTARLRLVGTNELEQTEYNLEKESNLLGRRDPMSNIFPEVDMSKFDPQTKISRKHARIWREGDMFMLEDLGSSNGTVLINNNNESVRLLPRQPHVLSHGDKVKLGDTTLRFTIG